MNFFNTFFLHSASQWSITSLTVRYDIFNTRWNTITGKKAIWELLARYHADGNNRRLA